MKIQSELLEVRQQCQSCTFGILLIIICVPVECMMGHSCISWDEMGTAMEELDYKLKAQ